MLRWHVVFAVFCRNVKQYFSGPLGYLFIVVFVTICAVMTFSPQFFADNVAGLDQLSKAFPMLLLFFIPAITMSIWAEEKRQGTDSILFTLPASDLDILVGKFLSVVAVYTIALFFSLFQLIKLAQIGNPDWGVIASTYVGYWLAGVALLAIGMFASSLTQSATIAFVLGALLCAIPVLIGQYFRGVIGLERLGFEWNLRDFTIGLIPLFSVLYFVGLAIFMLYLNLIVISRRHWSRGQHYTKAPHFLVRVLSLGVALAALGYLVNTAVSSLWTRADLTSERLFALDPVTLQTLQQAKESRRDVNVQAFVSKDVPREYVNAKSQLLGLLRQYNEFGGNYLNVRIVEVAPNSNEAAEARVAGIEPQFSRSEVGGRVIEQDVYLGLKISTNLGDVTLPAIDNSTSLEYELSRAIAFTIDRDQQITIGILDSDTFFGGPEIEGRRIPWAYEKTINELKKQFKLIYITQDGLADYLSSSANPEQEDQEGSAAAGSTSVRPTSQPLKTAPNVLVVADPSSLDDGAMESLVRYVQAGNPTVILADPLPFRWTYQHPTQIGVLNAPLQPRLSMRSPYRQILASSMQPKADGGTAARLMRAIGVQWEAGTAVWNLDNPHPNFKGVWPDYIDGQLKEYYGPLDKLFVFARDRVNHRAFNPDSSISGGLKELLFLFPGSLQPAADSPFQFQPLVSIGADSGTTPWETLTMTPKQEQRSLNRRTGEIVVREQAASSQITFDDLVILNPAPQYRLDDRDHVVAARIQGTVDQPLDVVVISDLDFVAEVAFEQEKGLDRKLDNLTLLKNAIEVLADKPAFVNLRNRRSRPRTLVQLEQVFENFRQVRAEKQQLAEEAMQVELAQEQARLNVATREIQADQSLSILQKLQRSSQEASDAQRRFDIRKRKLEKDLSQTISALQTEEREGIERVENWTRYSAILTAPIPALALGIFVLALRYYNEQKNIAPQRKV
jgi:ABC-2 type transport system permease protein